MLSFREQLLADGNKFTKMVVVVLKLQRIILNFHRTHIILKRVMHRTLNHKLNGMALKFRGIIPKRSCKSRSYMIKLKIHGQTPLTKVNKMPTP